MIYEAIIVEGGDFVATFLVYGQCFHYGNAVPHSGSNKRLNRLLLKRHRIRKSSGVVTLSSIQSDLKTEERERERYFLTD